MHFNRNKRMKEKTTDLTFIAVILLIFIWVIGFISMTHDESVKGKEKERLEQKRDSAIVNYLNSQSTQPEY